MLYNELIFVRIWISACRLLVKSRDYEAHITLQVGHSLPATGY